MIAMLRRENDDVQPDIDEQVENITMPASEDDDGQWEDVGMSHTADGATSDTADRKSVV